MFRTVLYVLLEIVWYAWYIPKLIVRHYIPKRFKRPKDLKGETVLITGAGSGFGREFAVRFSQLGCQVLVCDINEKTNEETCSLVRESGGDITGYHCDVSDREAVNALANKIKTEVGEIGILVNNAGIAMSKYLWEETAEEIERTIKVNLLAYFWTTKAFLPDMMRRNKGELIYVASLAGTIGSPKIADYCASKHGVMGFTEALKWELELNGYNKINITVGCPGLSKTGILNIPEGLPTLSAGEVVNAIVDGCLYNEEVVYVPTLSSGLWLFKFINISKEFRKRTNPRNIRLL